jgi:hypothetical protein
VSSGHPTIERLRWHAGLVDPKPRAVPSISSSTWPHGKRSADLEGAADDFLDALDSLNRELNGDDPSAEAASKSAVVSRDAAYAVAEVDRMLREHGNARREAWAVETAWLAILAGDVDDLREHLAREEAAAIDTIQVIYVELVGEGVTVYRPVEATAETDGSFVLPDRAPSDERWRFDPGSRVICELQDIGGGEHSLVATRLLS